MTEKEKLERFYQKLSENYDKTSAEYQKTGKLAASAKTKREMRRELKQCDRLFEKLLEISEDAQNAYNLLVNFDREAI